MHRDSDVNFNSRFGDFVKNFDWAQDTPDIAMQIAPFVRWTATALVL